MTLKKKKESYTRASENPRPRTPPFRTLRRAIPQRAHPSSPPGWLAYYRPGKSDAASGPSAPNPQPHPSGSGRARKPAPSVLGENYMPLVPREMHRDARERAAPPKRGCGAGDPFFSAVVAVSWIGWEVHDPGTGGYATLKRRMWSRWRRSEHTERFPVVCGAPCTGIRCGKMTGTGGFRGRGREGEFGSVDSERDGGAVAGEKASSSSLHVGGWSAERAARASGLSRGPLGGLVEGFTEAGGVFLVLGGRVWVCRVLLKAVASSGSRVSISDLLMGILGGMGCEIGLRFRKRQGGLFDREIKSYIARYAKTRIITISWPSLLVRHLDGFHSTNHEA